MKRLIYILPILLIACGQTNNKDKTEYSVDSKETEVQLATSPVEIKNFNTEIAEPDSVTSLEIFKDFAVNYAPSGIAMLPETSATVLKAISIVKITQPEEFEKYLTLIFVKLYSAHLVCCHQSYEIRRQPSNGIDKESNPLVYEFNTLTKMYPKSKSIEFISSGIGYVYVKSNQHLLDFRLIEFHVEIIEQVQKNIEEGVYWK